MEAESHNWCESLVSRTGTVGWTDCSQNMCRDMVFSASNSLHNLGGQKWSCLQGVKVNSGKSLGSKFGRIQCLHCNKRYLSRKSLISALIWHPESGCGTIRRLPRPHRRQEVKNPPRGPMLFAARGRDALLMMPRPLSRCQIKAEIKGFLLMYRLFL